MNFPTSLEEIEQRIKNINPERYAKTRNYGDGAVTFLSPYISRGVISTKQVYDHIKTLDLPWYKCEKLIQELAWRDYWQQVWIAKGDAVFTDLKNTQEPISNYNVPDAILNANTGIIAVDNAIKEMYTTGYMHNHMRMYVASICCNVANSHWLSPAKWLYSNLLDGDVASNHLSWQWVVGAFSNKKYYANQENINTFFDGDQKNTFLDIEYDQFEKIKMPEFLTHHSPFDIKTVLNDNESPKIAKVKTLVYNYYNIDPYWHSSEKFQRVFLLEPSLFEKHPVSKKCLDFVHALAQNIPDIKIVVGEFKELASSIGSENLVYKEHPTSKHYHGIEEPREWLSDIKGYYPSFFSFWKKCKKQL